MSSGLGPESSPRAKPVKTSSPASPTHNHRQAESIDVCSLIHGIHRASSDLSVRAECPTASRADSVQIVANLKLIGKSRQFPPDRPGSRALLSQPQNVGTGHLAQSPRALCPCHPTTSGDPVSYHLRADCLSLPNCGEN